MITKFERAAVIGYHRSGASNSDISALLDYRFTASDIAVIIYKYLNK